MRRNSGGAVEIAAEWAGWGADESVADAAIDVHSAYTPRSLALSEAQDAGSGSAVSEADGVGSSSAVSQGEAFNPQNSFSFTEDEEERILPQTSCLSLPSICEEMEETWFEA